MADSSEMQNNEKFVSATNVNVFGILSMFMEPEDIVKAPPLHQAICQGDYNKIVGLVNDGADINQRLSPVKPSPLYCAAYHGHLEILHILLGHTSICVTTEKVQVSELHGAVFNGHLKAARLLLQHGADINTKTPGNEWTPLHIACYNKQAEMIELLLEFNPKVNLMAYGSLMPIALIFMSLNEENKKLRTCRDHEKILQCLEVLLKNKDVDANHWSFHPGHVLNILPLERACRMWAPEIMRLLLNNGARADGVYHRTIHCIPLYHLYRKPEDEGTLFFQCSDEIHRFWQCVILLLDHGINQDVQLNFTRKKDKPAVTVRGSKLRLPGNIRVELARHSCPDNLKPEWMEFVDWLEYVEKNPSSLKNLCRQRIRTHLSHKLVFKIEKLPLPLLIKDYLLMYIH